MKAGRPGGATSLRVLPGGRPTPDEAALLGDVDRDRWTCDSLDEAVWARSKMRRIESVRAGLRGSIAEAPARLEFWWAAVDRHLAKSAQFFALALASYHQRQFLEDALSALDSVGILRCEVDAWIRDLTGNVPAGQWTEEQTRAVQERLRTAWETSQTSPSGSPFGPGRPSL